MRYRKEALIHPSHCFEQETILKRKESLGLTNEARIELFIWDLEIFCQIHQRLGNHIILKGGAAAQLYFPIDMQRTSIDIDMICSLKRKEIESSLKEIEKSFQAKGDLLKFRFHKPREAKTELPLLTYYLTIPSEIIRDNDRKGTQEIKTEFFLDSYDWPTLALRKPSIFALDTNQTYRILNLEAIIADKLTTLGPNTIGIPKERRDELCKQIYDLDGLLHYPNQGKHNILEVSDLYLRRAQLECESRDIPFKINEISKDSLGWLINLSSIDFEKDQDLEKDINDFQSLYLRRAINRGKSQWAIIGDKLRFYLSNLYSENISSYSWEEALKLEFVLSFAELSGKKKGEINRMFMESFSNAFETESIHPQKILKGKNPTRQMWHVIRPENISKIKSWIEIFKKTNNIVSS
jgi:predicted nucleotidyltransferase component of viral defense system